MTSQVIVFGVGQFADMAYYCLQHDSEWDVAAFTVDEQYMENDKYHDLPVHAFESLIETCPPDRYKIFIPISYKKVNREREAHYLKAKEMGYECISYVSSKANVAENVEIGDNCFIFELNNIQPYSKIGNNCILWSGNHIGHHSTIEDHCFIASHVVISGSVTVGHHSFIGVNATLRDNISIGPQTVIGAAAVILHDTEEKSVYTGNESKAARMTSDRLKGI